MAFGWTINPYRGCQHACVYCGAGETPILMADGRTKPLADIRVGDGIYGTVRRGYYRRYAITTVLAHWSTVKPAYRITLADGTQLIASGDHRFLTERGWKHVTGAEQGHLRRPFLTVNNKLMGTGGFAEPPKDTVDYRRGYLCGMVRGDGHLPRYRYAREEGNQFRLALVDDGGTEQDPLLPGHLRHRDVGAHLRRSSWAAEGYAGDIRVLGWLGGSDPAPDRLARGAHAGLAEGLPGRDLRRRGQLQPGDVPDRQYRSRDHSRTAAALASFGFAYEAERRPRGGTASSIVRLRGGLGKCVRFFHTVDPAITRKRSINGVALRSDAELNVTEIKPLGIEVPMYDITTGTGDFIANGVVSHNCFARNTHTYLDLDAGQDFDSKVVVKVNAPERLRKTLASARWAGEHIAMGTNVDCYQRAEGRYQLMRGIIAALRDYANPFSILTKGTLILRDLDLLTQAAEVTDVGLNVSVGFVDKALWRSLEPGTPSPDRRLDVCRTLNGAGLPCGVLMGPVVPFLSDSPAHLEAAVRRIAEAGATARHPDRPAPAARDAGLVPAVAEREPSRAPPPLPRPVRAGLLRAEGLPGGDQRAGPRTRPALRRRRDHARRGPFGRRPPRRGPHPAPRPRSAAGPGGGARGREGGAHAAQPPVTGDQTAARAPRGWRSVSSRPWPGKAAVDGGKSTPPGAIAQAIPRPGSRVMAGGAARRAGGRHRRERSAHDVDGCHKRSVARAAVKSSAVTPDGNDATPGEPNPGPGRPAPEPGGLTARTVPIAYPGDLLARIPPACSPAPALAWVRQGSGLVGWGEVARITLPAGEDRFTAGEKWLRTLFEGVVTEDQVGRPGTGPVAFGSFTFDPASDGSMLIVPRTILGRDPLRAGLAHHHLRRP